MANIPLQSITFPGLSDKYTTPTVDATLTQTGAAADAKKTGDEIAGLKNDFAETNSDASRNLKYINDISDIQYTYANHNTTSEDVTTVTGYGITASTGALSANSAYSYITFTVPEDGYFYCTASPSLSSVIVYSGLPLGTDTYLYGKTKSEGWYSITNPCRVYAGQVIAVSAKTSSLSQTSPVIYFSDNGTAYPFGAKDIDEIKKGYVLLSDIASFKIGRWGPDGSHTSSVMARSDSQVSVTQKTAAICDDGYMFYNYYVSDDNTSWTLVLERVCTIMLLPGKYYRLNVCYLDSRTLQTTDEVTTHVKLTDIITSEYEECKHTFFGLEMYNNVAFVGDSYTVKRSTYNNCWGQIIGQKLGINVSLFGHSGYSTNTFRTASGATDSLTGMLSASSNDLYWLGFGINDASAAKSNPAYIGSVSDLTGEYASYPNTLWGNYGCIIESIRATFPNAKIVLCNVMYHDMRTAQMGSDTVNIPAVNSAIADIAEHYGIPLIKLMDDVFYRSPEYDTNMQATAYTHPDPVLFPGMANANMRLFARAVADNPAYFKTSTAPDPDE